MCRYDSLKLKNQLCFPIYLCSKEIIRKYTPLLNELNLTYTQYIVMMYFWEVEESNLKDLGKTLMLDSSTLTPLLKKLELKGYIERKRNLNDERNLVIKLTKDGIGLRNKAIDIPSKMGKCVNLSDSEAKTLYSLIYKVLLNVKENDYEGKRDK